MFARRQFMLLLVVFGMTLDAEASLVLDNWQGSPEAQALIKNASAPVFETAMIIGVDGIRNELRMRNSLTEREFFNLAEILILAYDKMDTEVAGFGSQGGAETEMRGLLGDLRRAVSFSSKSPVLLQKGADGLRRLPSFGDDIEDDYSNDPMEPKRQSEGLLGGDSMER